MAWNPPALADQKGMRQIMEAVPKPVVTSDAYTEWVERQARRVGLRGPKPGGE